MATLKFLGKIDLGTHLIDTPVGVVEAKLTSDYDASIQNVPSYRSAANVVVEVDGYGPVQGDVAYGGNWFFLAKSIDRKLELSQVDELTDLACRIRRAVNEQGFPLVDHIELFGPPHSKTATLETLSCVPAWLMTDRHAEQGPAPSSHAWPPTASLNWSVLGPREYPREPIRRQLYLG